MMLDWNLVQGGLLYGSDSEQDQTETGECSRYTDMKTVMEEMPAQVGQHMFSTPTSPPHPEQG